MPLRKIAGTDFRYYLIAFDEKGVEQVELDGSRMSDVIRDVLASEPVTDVFFTSHGWKGDVPAAIEQYDLWVAAMAGLETDRALASERCPGFKPLVVGLHWPSLPFGDESLDQPAGAQVLSAKSDVDRQVEEFARCIADTPAARDAIRTILEAARGDAQTLSKRTRDAYATLFAESGLGTGDATGRPGSDQAAFDPAVIREDYEATQAPGDTALLGWTDKLKDAVLSPLRQLSFWKMKDRARIFGESGGHELLATLQADAPAARFHLMGHSFGCIVVSATVAGTKGSTPLPRPVDTLFLVQGALSLWSYAADIPYAPRTPGYFYRIVKQRLVRGPIVTTRSKFDTAVGRLYPLGARVAQQLVLGDKAFPEYGGVGSFGLQGVASVEDMVMQAANAEYAFRKGVIYNLESSGVIRNGGGASGAHSDIAHPEVAHAFWAAVLASDPSTLSDSTFLGATPESELLSAATPMAPAAPEPAIAAPPPVERRYINAEIAGHAKDKPLTAGDWYELAFDVDVTERADAWVATPLQDERLFAQGEEVVELTVELASDDFEIAEAKRRLRLPRTGKSQGKARFDVSPKRDGRASLTATFHKQGNFVQQLTLTVDVGAAKGIGLESVTRGRAISSAHVLFPRDVGILIQPGVGGYECTVWGPVAGRARLPLQPAYLASAIDTARDEIMKVVMHRDAAGQYVFQKKIDIPAPDRDAALRVMARAGATLFEQLFFGPGAAADSHSVGNFLRKVASDRATTLKVQILAETAPVPWGLIYLGDVADGAVLDWDNFLGMQHVIEAIPLQNQLAVLDSAIRSDQPSLSVSLNLNEAIDQQMKAPYVAGQKEFWAKAQQTRKRVRVTDRTKSAQLTDALKSATTDDQILYFYCHAESTGLNEPGGPNASSLVLTDAAVTLGDLNRNSPTRIQLAGNPLVFINACESGKMSPAFYDGFVPYFMAKGARGVVGTECKTPALFATEFARRFFERFLDGEALGDAFLGLRQEFLQEHGNPLGLMYAVHCDGDTQIQPALKA